MKTLVVYYNDTNEVIATIPLEEGVAGFALSDVSYRVFNDGVEPVFIPPDEELGIRLKPNACIVTLNKDERK